MAYDYSMLSTHQADGVMWVTVDAPPINVITPELFGQLAAFTHEVAADDAVGAVVLQSADPDFLLAHFDVAALVASPMREGEPTRPEHLNSYHVMCEAWRTMPKATLVKVAGRVGGGGAELAASADMRFGLLGKTIVNQMEVPIGILPGGTGTQRLPRLIGRGRALEVVLGGIDLDAATAERWGWLNRAFATMSELDAYVDGLARRIAGFPREAVALAKASVQFAEPDPVPGLLEEIHLFTRLMQLPASRERMQAFLDAGGQTREGELRVADLLA